MSGPEQQITQQGLRQAFRTMGTLMTLGAGYYGMSTEARLCRLIGGNEVYNDIIVASESTTKGLWHPDIQSQATNDANYHSGTIIGAISVLGASRRVGGITEANLCSTLAPLTSMAEDGMALDPSGSEVASVMVGGRPNMDMVLTEVNEFTEMFPGLYESKSPTPAFYGLWMGSFAMATAINNPTGEIRS